MPDFGYFLACDERSPAELVDQARTAEQARSGSPWVSVGFCRTKNLPGLRDRRHSSHRQQ
jgi:hypothetical protein